MATLGNSKNIIVGAAQVFISKQGPLEYYSGTGSAAIYTWGSGSVTKIPAFSASTKYADTVEAATTDWRNVGYTSNGLEIQFQPDFGEVQVDQILDVARMYKQGMQVSLVTAFAEGTLENLVVAAAFADSDLEGSSATQQTLTLNSGNLGEVPLERAIIAIGPGTGDPDAVGASAKERVYIGFRALSIENVTAMAKRDAPTNFEVTFRLMPANNGAYGKIVDRIVSSA
jgi:hypothetical protein